MKPNEIEWFYDIPSSNLFLKRKSAKAFELSRIAELVSILESSDDEIGFSISIDNKYRTRVSIWGVDQKTCEIEVVDEKICGCYVKSFTKKKMIELLPHIKSIAKKPKEYGLILKVWE